MRRIISLLFFVFCASVSAIVPAKPEHHVVVVVWDGMRPDFVTEQNTPTLWKLAREGTTFQNHHAAYPSATMVNGTTMVTGVYPGKSGIIANHVYRPDIDPHHAVDVELPPAVKKGDELSGGKYIAAPTIADLVELAGARSVIASAKTVGLLLDRHPNDVGAKNSATLFAGKGLPSAALVGITERLGPFPSAHLRQDSWTTKALIDVLWKDGVPRFSILWLGEPDLTQHETAPGAPAALAAIKSADENLAAVLSALDELKARGTTNVFVVSDHGDRKSTRLNSSHLGISYAVFCLKKKNNTERLLKGAKAVDSPVTQESKIVQGRSRPTAWTHEHTDHDTALGSA